MWVLLLLLSQEQMFSHLKIISGLVILEAKPGISIKMLKQHESAAVSNVLTHRSVENWLFYQHSKLPFGCVILFYFYFVAVDEFKKDLLQTKPWQTQNVSHFDGGSKLQMFSDLLRLGSRCRLSAAICWQYMEEQQRTAEALISPISRYIRIKKGSIIYYILFLSPTWDHKLIY